VAADDHVIDSDQPGQRADGKDDRERGETGGKESQTDDIGFARAPITIEERGRAPPINIARAMHRPGLRDN